MPQTPSARRSGLGAGQSIYEVMLITACAAMVLAVCFAVCEYFSFYRGTTNPSESVPRAAALPAPARKATPTPVPTGGPTMTPAPAGKAAPPPAPTAAPGATATPAPSS